MVEVIFENGQRKMRIGMGVEAFGDENVGTEIHGAAPEFCQQLALDAHVPDVLGIFGRIDRSDFLIEGDGNVLRVGA